MNIQRTISPPDGEDYKADFHAWLAKQADALRAYDATRLDWPNLLEEIETLGRSERLELFSRLDTILQHLVKYQYGINRDPASGWKRTIVAQRPQLRRRLKLSPSLYPVAVDALQETYDDARHQALASFEEHEPHRLATYEALIPKIVPYTLDQILDIDYLPEPTSAR